MSVPVDIDKARREAAAREIAQQVDPLAGGFFRMGLVDAALAGMKFERDCSPPLPAPREAEPQR
jgi:hypothetical protein